MASEVGSCYRVSFFSVTPHGQYWWKLPKCDFRAHVWATWECRRYIYANCSDVIRPNRLAIVRGVDSQWRKHFANRSPTVGKRNRKTTSDKHYEGDSDVAPVCLNAVCTTVTHHVAMAILRRSLARNAEPDLGLSFWYCNLQTYSSPIARYLRILFTQIERKNSARLDCEERAKNWTGFSTWY